MKRRILSVLALTGLFLGLGLPAQAATKPVPISGTNWFWRNQQRPAVSDFGVNCPPGTPVCPDQRAPGANPHGQGALPVNVINGEDEKISAIQFDLTNIIPFQGATISKFTFSVIESQDPQDRAQTVNVTGQKVLACLITESWPSSLEGGADEMQDAPEFDEAACATGVRKNTTPPKWDFDITTLAATWGTTPSSSHGVMLVGNKPKNSQETFQLVLKGPRRDDAATPDNEQKQNAKNIKASITFTPNADPSFGSTDFGTDFGSSSGDFGFGAGTAGTGTTPFPAASPGAGAPVSAFTSTGNRAGDGGGPQMPWYFWPIIPAGLLALSLVRHTVLEPLPGKRGDGAVALIRRHNAARLGRPLTPDVTSPFAALTRGLRTTGHRIRSLTRRVIRGGKRP